MGPCPCPPPDVDECAWPTDLCLEGQRCVNLLGSHRCFPDCGPGFRVAADGADCEGDRGTCEVVQDSADGALCHWDAGPSGKTVPS